MEVHEKRKLLEAIDILIKRPAQADETTLGNAMPDGFVVVPVQCPDPDFADSLFDELSKKAIGEFGDDLLIHFSDIDEEKIWALMVEAAKAQAVPEGFVLVSKTPSLKVLDRLYAEHDIDEERAAYIYRDIINAQEPAND